MLVTPCEKAAMPIARIATVADNVIHPVPFTLVMTHLFEVGFPAVFERLGMRSSLQESDLVN